MQYGKTEAETLRLNGWGDAVSEDPEEAINIFHAIIAKDVVHALRQGAKRHHLDKAPNAAQAVSFLLSLAQQEADKLTPLNLTA